MVTFTIISIVGGGGFLYFFNKAMQSFNPDTIEKNFDKAYKCVLLTIILAPLGVAFVSSV